LHALALTALLVTGVFNSLVPHPGDQEGKAAVPTSYGCIVAGNTPAGGSGDTQVLLAGFDNAGELLWVDSLIRGRSCNLISMTAVEGGMVITGSMTEEEVGVMAMALFVDENGQVLWEYRNRLSNEHFTSACQGVDGTILCAGGTTNEGAGGFDVVMAAMDPDGTLLWRKTLGTAEEETAHHVAPCADGGYIISGLAMGWGAGLGDYWIIRTDSQGDTLWSTTCGGPQFDYPWRTIQHGDCFYVTGSTLSFGMGSYDWWVLKLDDQGAIIWDTVWGNKGTDTSMALTVSEGRAVAAGYSEPETGNIVQTVVLFGEEDGEVLDEWVYDAGLVRQITELPGGGFLLGGSGILIGEDVMAKEIDAQGNCPPLGIGGSVTPNAPVLSPNPACSMALFRTSPGATAVQVFDLSGRLVWEGAPADGSLQLDVTGFRTGVYLVSDGVALPSRLVVLR